MLVSAPFLLLADAQALLAGTAGMVIAR